MSVAEKERFFYHSFPRRGSNSDLEIDKGCKILSLICESGLLLAPEVVTWQYPHADGSPPRIQTYIQRRVCFTELSPSDLAEHGEIFGRFALEFEIDVLKVMGALPVFYIPQATSTNSSDMNSLGSVLVNQMIDAAMLTMRLAGVRELVSATPETETHILATMGGNKFKDFVLNVKETRNVIEAFCYALTPPDMLEQSLYALLHCFYPADNLRDNKALAYYRQREWRISHNFAIRGEDVMRRVSDEMIARLIEIDAQFFGRDFQTAAGLSSLGKESWIFPGLGGKRVIEMAHRVIVPASAFDRATRILGELKSAPPIVAIESLGS